MNCLACCVPLPPDGACATVGCILQDMPQRQEHDRIAANEFRQQQIIEHALHIATAHIMEMSNGTAVELDYLTAMLAKKLIEEALSPFGQQMLKAGRQLLKKEIEERLQP